MEIVDSVYDQYQYNNERINLTYDISQLVIPFSKVFKSYKPRDIYSGNEKIPFQEREQSFKMILKQEFSNLLKV